MSDTDDKILAFSNNNCNDSNTKSNYTSNSNKEILGIPTLI